MDEPRWLSPSEQAAWRQLIAVVLKLPGTLEAQLRRDAGMTHFEYWVVALLSEAEDRRLRMSELASQANASLSRLSHVVTRLERRGLVRREPSADDARGTETVLTDEGYEHVLAAAPGHVEQVRRQVFDPLDARDVEDLTRIAGRIAARLP